MIMLISIYHFKKQEEVIFFFHNKYIKFLLKNIEPKTSFELNIQYQTKQKKLENFLDRQKRMQIQ